MYVYIWHYLLKIKFYQFPRMLKLIRISLALAFPYITIDVGNNLNNFQIVETIILSTESLNYSLFVKYKGKGKNKINFTHFQVFKFLRI